MGAGDSASIGQCTQPQPVNDVDAASNSASIGQYTQPQFVSDVDSTSDDSLTTDSDEDFESASNTVSQLCGTTRSDFCLCVFPRMSSILT